MEDTSKFPAPSYARTVLAPLFAGFIRHYRGYLLAIHEAHGLMLLERGWLTRAQARAIFAALRDIAAAQDFSAMCYDGRHEDYFFWLEGELADRVGIDISGRLHTGRNRNDIDHTMYKMALRARLLGLAGKLHALIAVLLDRAERDAGTLVVAYTHGQPAQPTTFGHYLAALIEVLLRDAGRLRHALNTVDCSSLGAAAITTSGFGLDRERTASLLGFAEVQQNSYGCIAAVDYVAESMATLKVLLIGIGRFVQDLNTWTGFEVGHLRVPDGFVQMSSIMPQKRNPVPVEHLRLMASLAAGRADAVLLALHNTPFTDMNDSEGTVQAAGYEAIDTAGDVLDLLAAFVNAVSVDEERVRGHIAASCITITELADTLVRREKLSFRQAHGIAATLARRIVARAETLANVPMQAFADAFERVAGRKPGLDEAALREVTTAEHFVAVRDMIGGPAPAALGAALAGYRVELGESEAACAAVSARLAAAETTRAELVTALLSAE